MNLEGVLADLGRFDLHDTIYALEPWRPESEAVVGRELEDGSFPPEAKSRGMSYFLEVSIALELRKDLNVQPDQLCARIIQYATNDA